MRRAGAIPVVIPPMDAAAIDPLLDGLSGLCLSGGPDLQPSCYGAEPHPALGPTEPHLDIFEIALLRAAESRGMPVLAICRGLQVLNVSRGGTLIQDLPSQRPSPIEHRQTLSGSTPTHDVTLQDSLTADCLGAREARVNSFHHQAVDRLGDGLRAVGWAPDGVIEAIEATDRSFTVARPSSIACWRRSRRSRSRTGAGPPVPRSGATVLAPWSKWRHGHARAPLPELQPDAA
jgi:putative glutamine amidotransferase